MTLIDTHCHIYLEEFEADRTEMMNRAALANVTRLYMPAINSTTHDKMMTLEQEYPNNCFPMIGLHPCYVKEDYRSELQLVHDWLEKRKFCAIGECGLDLYWDKTHLTDQIDALTQQIEWAKKYKLPLILHTRNATKETIDLIKKNRFEGMRGIFHCFGGSLDEANEIFDLGFLVGIGGVVTYKNAGLDKIMMEIPLSGVVLETDAPYLAPVPNRGKRNEPSMLPIIAAKIAQIKNCSVQEVIQITTRNADQLFQV